MSMTCFIKEENDIIELKQYSAIKKISELSNRFTKTGVDHGYNSPEIEMSYGVRTYEMDVLKVSRSRSVGVFLFFLLLSEKKWFILIYSSYKDLFNYGITFENKDKQTDVTGYSLKIREKKLKRLYFEDFIFS